jgi:hypothetical protein
VDGQLDSESQSRFSSSFFFSIQENITRKVRTKEAQLKQKPQITKKQCCKTLNY